MEVLGAVVGERRVEHLAVARIVIGRTAHPAEGFGGVHGLEVAPGLGSRSVLEQFLGRSVVPSEALDVLYVQADARSRHVRGVRLQEVLAPVPGEGVGRGVAIGCD